MSMNAPDLITAPASKQGAMLSELEIIIGEFFPQPVCGSRVFASVYSTEAVHGKLIVRDRNGRVQVVKTFELEKEGDALELDISSLQAGEYQVQIRMRGQSWKRKLWVQRQRNRPKEISI